MSFIDLKAQSYLDKPYLQDKAHKYELKTDLRETQLWQVKADRNKRILAISSKGLLLPWGKQLTKDLQYRPINDMDLVSIATYKDQFIYLTDKAVISNAWAGKYYFDHQVENPSHFAFGNDFSCLVIGENEMKLWQGDKNIWRKPIEDFQVIDVLFQKEKNSFLILTSDALYQIEIQKNKLKKVFEYNHLSALALYNNEIILGTKKGILKLDKLTFIAGKLDNNLPYTEITKLTNINGSLWVGTTKGAFKFRSNNKYDYYASKRWLVDDSIVDISSGPDNSVLLLSKTGLSQISFTPMTLAEKANYFQEIQRLRHIRYGFNSETNLKVAGDLSTTVLTDTDNDGLWTSMYLAAELFRYAVTKDKDAKLNAYEAFETMERLTEVSNISGFPARTYELDSYQSSDNDPHLREEEKIWQLVEKDPRWRWKSSTSSDESCGHFFVYALFAELAPDEEMRQRAIHQIKIEMDHIIDNNWYLVTWNGEPTIWGRWNPEYVNSFPINVGDRRLNSTLILSFLQTAYHFTGDIKYKEKAQYLIEKHGYDENANRLASDIGYVEGENLSDRWNHSDDEMYFLTVPAFVNYSFSEEEKAKHFETAKSHWEYEKSERNPLWDYLFAMTAYKDFDMEASTWWLREFPMDLIDWEIDNSHRTDLVILKPNFRNQTYSEVLPPDERVMGLHNGAYRNNGGNAGYREYPPYIYLLPYWAGRYVEAISAPITK